MELLKRWFLYIRDLLHPSPKASVFYYCSLPLEYHTYILFEMMEQLKGVLRLLVILLVLSHLLFALAVPATSKFQFQGLLALYYYLLGFWCTPIWFFHWFLCRFKGFQAIYMCNDFVNIYIQEAPELGKWIRHTLIIWPRFPLSRHLCVFAPLLLYSLSSTYLLLLLLRDSTLKLLILKSLQIKRNKLWERERETRLYVIAWCPS